MFDLGVLLGALLIFILRITNVSLATLRTLIMVQGRRGLSAVLGFFEALVFVLTVVRVVADFNNVWYLLGYAGGFSVGTLVGMWLEDRLALGFIQVRAIATRPGCKLADNLRSAGFGVTETFAEGRDGEVEVVEVVVRRKNLPKLVDTITAHEPSAFITVADARTVLRGYVPPVR